MARLILGLSQLAIGMALVTLAIIVHLRHAESISSAFGELDTLSSAAQSEIEVGQTVLQDVGQIAASFRDAIPLHRRTLIATRDSSKQVAQTIAAWRKEIPQLQKTASDATAVCEGLSRNLPLRIPSLTLTTQEIQFEVPEIETSTKTISIPYPTARVENGSQVISYPSGARVNMETWEKSLGSLAGKSLGGLSFKYPSGLDVSSKSLRLDYPKSIDIGRETMNVEVPASPTVRMQKRSFDVPSEPKITFKEILSDEKQLLAQSARQLKSLDVKLAESAKTLDVAQRLAADDAPQSINATLELLELSGQQLGKLCDDRIPTTLKMLTVQHEQIKASRETFASLRPLIGATLLGVALLGLAVAISGVARLVTPHD